MWLTHWRRNRSSARAPRFRPRLEALDDRRLPSTFTVTNLLDDGPASLRAAVAAANANPGPDAIDFATTGTIALTGGELDIYDSVTINGPGAGALTVSGEGVSRVFNIVGAPTVSIANLTVANGSAQDWGGGIYMAGGTVTLAHCTVSGNTTYGINDPSFWEFGVAAGGGLYVEGGILTLDQCAVSGNSAWGATDINGCAGLGGGLYVAGGTVTMTGCTVSGNSAGGGSAFGGYQTEYGGDGGRAEGGGIYVGSGTVSVDQTTVSDNRAIGGTGGDADQQFWWGWADTYGGNGGAGLGGGIRVAAGTLEASQTTITGNSAAGGAGGAGGYAGLPGASEGGGLDITAAQPPLAPTYLDSFTVAHAVNNNPDDVAGPYFLDGLPRLAIGDVAVVEGNAGATALVLTVTRSGPSDQPVSVDYATANGTATAGSDYAAASGTLTIPSGQMTGTITVLVNGDRLAESNETFFINLGNAANAAIADGQGVGTIVDDEPRVSINNVAKSEGRKNQRTLFTFTVTLSAAYDQAVTMSYRTTDGTATMSDKDYVAQTGTLTFAPGDTAKTITIVVNGDNNREADESFYLDLIGNSGNSLFTKNRGTGTILNDD